MVSLTASSFCLNQTRFDELFRENTDAIRRYIASLQVEPNTVEDILQDTAIALWNKFDAYDSSRPFAPWACRFAFLQVLKHRQRCARDRLVLGCEKRLEGTPSGDCQPTPVHAARMDALAKSLSLLQESDRLLIHRRYESKETIQTLAKQNATSCHKLYHALDRVRETLRASVIEHLKRDGWEHHEIAPRQSLTV